jgi:hypothetical protein
MRLSSCAIVCLIVAATSVAAAPKFRMVWKTPEVSQLNFAGKKVAALVITDDQSLQMSGEEALTRELNARGVTGLSTYRVVPREELRNAEKARPWFERAGAQGVVALRPVSLEKSRAKRTFIWSGYYQEFWGYYGYSWQTVTPVSTSDTTIVVVETLIYDLARNRLVWAATSETKNPKNLQTFITELIDGVVREMRKMKFVSQDAARG